MIVAETLAGPVWGGHALVVLVACLVFVPALTEKVLTCAGDAVVHVLRFMAKPAPAVLVLALGQHLVVVQDIVRPLSAAHVEGVAAVKPASMELAAHRITVARPALVREALVLIIVGRQSQEPSR